LYKVAIERHRPSAGAAVIEDLMPAPSASHRRFADDADAAILARIAGGDCDALGELCDRWEGRVHGFAACAFHDAAECEAVVEEVFWAVWRQAGNRGWTATAPAVWLRGIVWDVCRPRLAHRADVSAVAPADDDAGNLRPNLASAPVAPELTG
jgi:DNA-directed RNA polymerase specialized sigma24 family protein